jgi:O-antigen/teichoic acid export membrane protein
LIAAVHQLSPAIVVGVYLVASVISAAAAIGLAISGPGTRIAFSPSLARALVAYGIKSHTSGVSSMLNERLDQLLISVFLAPAKLGLYVVAVTLTSLTQLVGTSVGLVGLPTVTRLRSQAERRRAASRMIGLTLIGSIVVTVPLILLTPTLIQVVFGAPFVAASDAARILLVAAILLSVTKVLEATLKAVNRPLDAGAAQFAALLVTAAGLAALLPAFGIVGAAVASLLAYGVGAGWCLRRAATALEIAPRVLLWWPRDLGAGAVPIAAERSGGER